MRSLRTSPAGNDTVVNAAPTRDADRVDAIEAKLKLIFTLIQHSRLIAEVLLQRSTFPVAVRQGRGRARRRLADYEFAAEQASNGCGAPRSNPFHDGAGTTNIYLALRDQDDAVDEIRATRGS